MASNHDAASKTGSRETLYAILGSFVISIVLATILSGNPFRALSLAYHDYSQTPASSAAPAATK